MSTSISLAIAVDYATRGWQCFPLKPQAKEPATGSGFRDATTNPAKLRRWFGEQFPYNIGIRTGVASRVWVVDCDGETGFLNLAKLEAEHGQLPPTLISFTSNGCHFWFSTAEPIPCSVGRIADGIDVRACGGYVVAPPSVHPDGPAYRWSNARPPAVAPEWLIRLAHQRPTRREPQAAVTIASPPSSLSWSEGQSAWARAALDREIEELAATAQGGRNEALNTVSFRLHQIVAGGLLEASEVKARLVDATIANGLMDDKGNGGMVKVLRTIHSGAAAGLRSPRGPRQW